MSEERLDKLIEDFSHKNVNLFFRDRCEDYAETQEDLSQYDDEKFSDFQKAGEIRFGDGQRLVVATSRVSGDLSERSGKKAQYEKAKKVLRELTIYDAGFFVFFDDAGSFRFSLVYGQAEGTKRSWSNFRRFTYYVSRDQTNWTFRGRVGGCTFSSLNVIRDAFSVEKVTKDFYRQIADWYFWAIQSVTFPKDAEAEENGRNIAVIRLITRLIFIWFMKQRKLVSSDLFDKETVSGLLVSLHPQDTTYYKAILQNLFFATLNTRIDEREFRFTRSYHGRNTDYMNHGIYRYEDYFKNRKDMLTLFMDIPFLNGGLFDCLDWSARESGTPREVRFDGFSDKDLGLSVPNYLFFSGETEADLNAEYGTKNKRYRVQGLLNVLSAYNFTIDENDPIDQEVALDPELLGKVFENLLASFNPETATTARKSTGSYYTPREIVDYMVTQSLRQYYRNHLQDVADIDDKLEELLSPVTADEPANPFDQDGSRRIVSLTEELRIVDPAVGSGAFPMGILNKLVAVLARVDPDNRLWQDAQLRVVEGMPDRLLRQKLIEQINEQFSERSSNYGRKLYLIQKCIYGVDIQQIAIEIAKLRFFIALLVDERIDRSKPNWGIEPLPNLDFKLMQGNSLISEFMGINLDSDDAGAYGKLIKDETEELISEYKNKKTDYQYEPDRVRREVLKQDIDKLIVRIFESKLQSQKAEYLAKLRNIEHRYADLPDTRQRDEAVRKDTATLNRNYGFDLAQAERQLKEFTSGLKVRPFFAWNLYFAEVFQEKGGFDIVIANPPYGFRNVLTAKEKDYFRRVENIAFSSGDSAELFSKKSFNGLVRMNGILTFLIPKKSLYGDAWSGFRRDLWGKYKLTFLLDVSKAFEGVLFEESAFGLVKARQDTMLKLCYLAKSNTICEFTSAPKETVFMPNNTVQMYKALYPGSLFTKIICRSTDEKLVAGELGLAIGTDFFSDIETGYKLLKGIDVQRWRIRRHRYLANAHKLNWNDATKFLAPKVIAQVLLAHIENPHPHIKITACLDDEGIIITNTLTAFRIDRRINPKFWLAYLNSSFVGWYAYNYIYSRAIRTMHFYNFYIQQLPIPKRIIDNTSEQLRFVATVDAMLAITKDKDYLSDPVKQADVKDLERQLDEMVYELYELTPEEIAVVEGSHLQIPA